MILQQRQTSIRRRLMSDLVLLIVLTGTTILAATWYLGTRTIKELSTSLIDRTARRIESELHDFFGIVQSNVLIGRDWASAGILDPTDYDALNALFVPILRQYPQLSSMMVADSDGAEYLLLRDPLDSDSWSNRIVQADRWGTKVFNRQWNSATGIAEEGFGELVYDPRERIWYQQALLTSTDEPVFWTEPVIFFVTKDPGITAATHLVTEDQLPRTIVVAFDLLLMDISKFTTTLNVSERGKAFVLVEDHETREFKVVGLPDDGSIQSDSAIRDALVFVPPETAIVDSEAQLPPPETLGVPSVEAAVRHWTRHGQHQETMRYSAGGEAWWGGFSRYPMGANTFWIGVVVPEQDLSARIQLQQWLLMGIVLGLLAVGVGRAVVVSRRFSAPIESLVDQSEQISQGDLEPPPAIKSNIQEISRLADAHDQMREGLKSLIKLKRLERDLDIARNIQLGLLPEEPPATPGYAVDGWNLPADETGGDYFDWLTLPDGRTLFTLADVSGHGIGPALIVAMYRTFMRATTGDGNASLSAVVGRVNELLYADIPEGRFITAAIGTIDPIAHRVELLSAGQAPLLFFEAATKKLANWEADGPPLGIIDGVEFAPPRRIDFLPGDTLVLTTDGFFEATNDSDEQFGIKALEDFVREHHHLSPEALIQLLYQKVQEHVAGERQGDDLTALVIKRLTLSS